MKLANPVPSKSSHSASGGGGRPASSKLPIPPGAVSSVHSKSSHPASGGGGRPASSKLPIPPGAVSSVHSKSSHPASGGGGRHAPSKSSHSASAGVCPLPSKSLNQVVTPTTWSVAHPVPAGSAGNVNPNRTGNLIPPIVNTLSQPPTSPGGVSGIVAGQQRTFASIPVSTSQQQPATRMDESSSSSLHPASESGPSQRSDRIGRESTLSTDAVAANPHPGIDGTLRVLYT